MFFEKRRRFNTVKPMLLIWDFDDTIIATNSEFEKTNEWAANIISQDLYGNKQKVQEILQIQRKIDIDMVKKYGFVRPRYLLSWYATYEHFCKELGVTSNETTKKQLEECINDVYVRPFQNIPGAISVLEELRNQEYEMVILTAGEEEIQKRRVKESGALEFVREVIVYPMKTPATLRKVIEKYSFSDYAMIGNSLKSDIYPALENDVWGIHIVRQTWEADHYDIDKNHYKYVRLHHISEVPSTLEEIVQQKVSYVV